MNSKKDYWFHNAILLALLAVLCFFYFKTPPQEARAAGGGWDTNGIMALNMKDALERLVLVDTTKQNICVYKMRGVGEFRLVGARSYKYDVELKETKGSSIEKKNGITFFDAKRIYDQQEKDGN